MKPASPAAFCGQMLFKFDGHFNMRKYFLVTFNFVQSHTGEIYSLIKAGIRSGATVGPDVFKVLYLEKHTEILCDCVLTKLENGPLYSSTDRVHASKNGHLAADIIWQQDSFHYRTMLPCIAGLHPQSPRQFLWQPSQTLEPSNLSYVIAATMKADGHWPFTAPIAETHCSRRARLCAL